MIGFSGARYTTRAVRCAASLPKPPEGGHIIAADRLRGALLALGAATSFAVTVVVQRRLANEGLEVTAALGVRFAISAVLLFAILAVSRSALAPVRGERLRAIGIGGVGYAVQAGVFFAALQRGSAGAVALLFYAYPAFVMVAEYLLGAMRPTRRTGLALVLSSGGAGLVVLAGSEIDISGVGILLALTSALCFTVYLVASARLLRRSQPAATAAWVAAGASVVLLAAGALTRSLDVPGRLVPLLIVNGAFTASAFTLMYAALPRLGAGPTAVVMTIEAFATIVLAAATLGEPVSWLQVAGGAAIVAGAIAVSREVAVGAGDTLPPPP